MPRFMCVGNKPHPVGNERHTICCGLTSISWRDQTVEGKYCPQQLGKKEYNKSRKTVSLMLRMCRHIFGSGKAIALDSGFVFAKGIIELESKGVYEADMIKKWNYRPKGVPGELIANHFEDKEFHNVVMIEVRIEGNKLFKIFCMKEPNYAMKIMVSWRTLDKLEGTTTRIYFIDISGTNETKQLK